ncbi:SAM-dependent methyltransferase [Rhabdothermincola sediminis]|uniref:SAM-dependent methyltransferase n=1 Tax=Rhabdothermincola sediminis TaxID=2751370 RepID=UPI001AA0793F|nr:SAM-dependent methyltransferase [Rhabdothermincola sediminis]
MPASSPVEREVRARIDRYGPLPFDDVIELALYDPDHGFYTSGGLAGRRGDFITSPEVGPLFGAVVAEALDRWWEELGRPDPFVVVDAGAGVGTLAIAVRAASPRCGASLTYVLVERSAALRARHGDHLELTVPQLALPPAGRAAVGACGEGRFEPVFISLAELPAVGIEGVVIANELLDNLPFKLLERGRDRWAEVRVGVDPQGRLVEVLIPAEPRLARLGERFAPEAPVGARIPLQLAASRWLREALTLVERGRVVVLDYASDTPSLARRSQDSWLRTFRGHQRGGPPLERLGSQDVTCEVAVDQLAQVHPPEVVRDQAAFLRAHDIDELVEEGRRTWHQRAHIGDLAALRARSRVREAEALLDPTGLGGFQVLEWKRPP